MTQPQPQPSALPRKVAHRAIDAIRANDPEALRALLAKHGPEFAKKADPDRFTPLHVAASTGALECLRILLPHSDPAARNLVGETALHQAARRGHAECAQALAPVSDRNAVGERGITPLRYACDRRHAACVAALAPTSLAALIDKGDAAALTWASSTRSRPENRHACINALMSAAPKGFRWDGRAQEIVLTLAGAGDSASLAELLPIADLEKQRFPDRGESVAWHAMRKACSCDSAACVKLLLAAGAAPREQGASHQWCTGRTILMEAAEHGAIACVNLLLPMSDAAAIDLMNLTAFSLAAQGGYRECVNALLPATPPEMVQKACEGLIAECMRSRWTWYKDGALDKLLVALFENGFGGAAELHAIASEALSAERLPRASAASERHVLAIAVRDGERAAESMARCEAADCAGVSRPAAEPVARVAAAPRKLAMRL